MPEHVLSVEKQPAEKPFPWRCPKCRQPTVTRVTMPYSCKRTLGNHVVTVEVPNLAVPRCSNCGELVFDYAADEQIRAAFRTQFGPAETAMSEGQEHRSERAGALEEQIRPFGAAMLTELCVYTIKHSHDLMATLAKGGRDTYTERKCWTRAKQLLDSAKRRGQRLPIIFAPAEETCHLFAWALLDDVVPGETTIYSFSELQRFMEPPPLKTTLVKARDGEPLAEQFIRPYAICNTPSYLAEQLAQSGGRSEEEGDSVNSSCADGGAQ
jgi:hypothetical protein